MVTIKQYVETRGVHKVAALCRVTTQTVYNWVNYATYPDPFLAYLMVADSMKMLTYESIYSNYVMANFGEVSKHKAKDFTTDVRG